MRVYTIKEKVSVCVMLWCLSGLASFAMAGESDQKNPSLGKVIEISVAVNDLQKSTQQYAKILGLSQWQYFDLSISSSDSSVQVRPQLRVARTQWQDVTFELIQPLADSSPVKSFLSARGEGLYSVGLQLDAVMTQMSSKLEPLFSAETVQGRYATWWDSYDALGIYVKTIESEYTPKPWGKAQISTATPMADRVFQLGIVVADVSASAKNYQSLLGLAPWMVVDFQAPHVSNAQYLGAFSADSSDTVIQVGYGNWSGLQIELLAPITGPSPHRDFLITKGAGAHHLSFGAVETHDELIQHYVDLGLQIQMQSDNGGAGRTATYMASEDELGFVLELTRVAEGPGSLRPSAVIGLPSNVKPIQ